MKKGIDLDKDSCENERTLINKPIYIQDMNSEDIIGFYKYEWEITGGIKMYIK